MGRELDFALKCQKGAQQVRKQCKTVEKLGIVVSLNQAPPKTQQRIKTMLLNNRKTSQGIVDMTFPAAAANAAAAPRRRTQHAVNALK
jgi:hypothetical protein